MISPLRSCTQPSIEAAGASADEEAANLSIPSWEWVVPSGSGERPAPPAGHSAASAAMPVEFRSPQGDRAKLSCTMNSQVTIAWIRSCTWSGTSSPPFSMPRFRASQDPAGMLRRLPLPSRCTNQCRRTVENMSWANTSELARYCRSSCPANSPLPRIHSEDSARCRDWASARCFLHQTRATPLTRRSIICRSSGNCMAWNANTRAETTPVCNSAMESKMPKRTSGQSEKVAPRNAPTFRRLASPLLRIIFIAAV
mmetsp:Transcript_8712/g.27147  ORF Transcript_8712/g.27147 Transcript_8712/m.27147 type:complete len:255 (-) Transcript_8712:904-1668(-)